MIKSTPTSQKAPFEFLNDAPELRRYWDANCTRGPRLIESFKDKDLRCFCDTADLATIIAMAAVARGLAEIQGDPVQLSREECTALARQDGCTRIEIMSASSGKLEVVEMWPVS